MYRIAKVGVLHMVMRSVFFCAVDLTEGSLRFAGKDPKPYQGRLELYNGTEWGTICYNGWDTPDARVACRQMTFPGVAGRLVYTSGGGSSQPIWFDDVSCNGSETNLLQCRNNRNHNCHHNMDVGVLCSLLGTYVHAYGCSVINQILQC